MLEVATQIGALLSARRKRQIAFLLLLTLVTTAVQVASVLAVFPFLTLVTSPDSIESSRMLSTLAGWFHVESGSALAVWVGLMIVALLAIGNALGAAQTWIVYRVAWRSSHEIARDLLARYLSQPYSRHLNKNTAGLSSNLLTEVQEMVRGVLIPATQAVAKGTIALCIIGVLVIWDPMFALVSTAVFAVVFYVLFLSVRNILSRVGRERVAANGQRYKIANEILGGIREIKLLKAEKIYVKEFDIVASRYTERVADADVIPQMPRFAIEFLGLGAVIGYVTYLVATGVPAEQLVPTVGLYAFAGYRVMPNVQQVFISITRIRLGRPLLARIYDEWSDAAEADDSSAEGAEGPGVELRRRLDLEDVEYAYPGTNSPAVSEISLTVNKGESIALVGASGGGKSTILDLIIGLLRPDAGVIRVDGRRLGGSENWRWGAKIGYVSQNIYLTDDTIAANIAFGEPKEKIDLAVVARAAREAAIDEFIRSLPDGYNARTGERGVRLSGGQRQRIAIARALYSNPEVLIMDEATSSLDSETERQVLDGILPAGNTRTVIMVAHRESAIAKCDKAYLIEAGRISWCGDPTDPYIQDRLAASSNGRNHTDASAALLLDHQVVG